MWTWIFDSAAAHACNLFWGLAGHYPESCLVSAGRPFLAAAVAATLVVAITATLIVKRVRAV